MIQRRAVGIVIVVFVLFSDATPPKEEQDLWTFDQGPPPKVLSEEERRKFSTIPTTQPFEGGCGRRVNNGGQNVNGFEADRRAFPWIVSLRTREPQPNGKHFCTGTLIRSNPFDDTELLVTTASCFNGKAIEDLKVVAGTRFTDKSGQHKYARTVQVLGYVVDGGEDLPDNIAIARLSAKIKFNNNVQAACLPESWIGDGEWKTFDGTVPGWGLLDYMLSQLVPSKRQPVDVAVVMRKHVAKFVNSTVCSQLYVRYFNRSTMFCAELGPGNARDPGSPYLAAEYGAEPWTMYGVIIAVSYASDIALFMRIKQRMDWMTPYIKNPNKIPTMNKGFEDLGHHLTLHGQSSSDVLPLTIQ